MIGTNGPPLRLTTGAAPDYGPAWSPDGRFIAFLRRLPSGKNAVLMIPAIGGLERKIAEREAELASIRGEHVEAGWGNQIRSYVLQPYQMVKDHRTNAETSDTGGVLDGDLDRFMLAELERVATGTETGADAA